MEPPAVEPHASAPVPVFDGHNDTLLDVHAGRSFLVRSEQGHLDLPRARAGGFAGGLFAIFTRGQEHVAFPPAGIPRRGPDLPPEPPVGRGLALRRTLAVLGELLALEAEAPEAIRVVRTAAEVEASLAAASAPGPLAAVIHVEGAEVVDPGLAGLGALHALGVRSLGITWSRPNVFGHGVPFAFRAAPDIGPGLTGAGRALVRACNELGILLDVSHLNARGVREVSELSQAPLVASHSGAHALSPAARNLTDAQLDRVGASDGLVGIVFNVADLRADGRFDPDSTPRALIARHAAYVAERIGVEHVALGSDFDGCLVPTELRDASGLPGLLDDLRAVGFDDAEVRAVAHGNWLRVLRATWGA